MPRRARRENGGSAHPVALELEADDRVLHPRQVARGEEERSVRSDGGTEIELTRVGKILEARERLAGKLPELRARFTLDPGESRRPERVEILETRALEDRAEAVGQGAG
jgi:hypothetical protein